MSPEEALRLAEELQEGRASVLRAAAAIESTAGLCARLRELAGDDVVSRSASWIEHQKLLSIGDVTAVMNAAMAAEQQRVGRIGLDLQLLLAQEPRP